MRVSQPNLLPLEEGEEDDEGEGEPALPSPTGGGWGGGWGWASLTFSHWRRVRRMMRVRGRVSQPYLLPLEEGEENDEGEGEGEPAGLSYLPPGKTAL
jgi:hypothetical protein